jgi:hypothetical protein
LLETLDLLSSYYIISTPTMGESDAGNKKLVWPSDIITLPGLSFGEYWCCQTLFEFLEGDIVACFIRKYGFF